MHPPPAILLSAYDDLVTRYSAPSRHYHNLAHIQACLDLFFESRHHFRDPTSAEIAFWFHDAIYDATRSDNEAQSADLATRFLSTTQFPPDQIARIADLILATRHRDPPTDLDAQLLTDIDLSILAAPPPVYDAYELAIRHEYAHYPDEAFFPGRAKFLQSLLARPHLYASPLFHPRFESPARKNLSRALTHLTTPQ